MHTNLKELIDNLGVDVAHDDASGRYVPSDQVGKVAATPKFSKYQHHWSNDKYQFN